MLTRREDQEAATSGFHIQLRKEASKMTWEEQSGQLLLEVGIDRAGEMMRWKSRT